MAVFNPVGPSAPSSVEVKSKTTLNITGAVVGTTETTIVIPAGTKAFQLHTAKGSNAILTIASAITGTSSPITSWDIGMGNVWKEDLLTGTNAVTVYIKSNKVATNVQLLYWT